MKLTLIPFYFSLLVSVFAQNYADNARRGAAIAARRRNNIRWVYSYVEISPLNSL